MKKILIILLCFSFLLVGWSTALSKTVHVRSYHRKDGTYVHGYDRRSKKSSYRKHHIGATCFINTIQN